MSAQIGQFFLMIGLILMTIFLVSDVAHTPALEYFCFGVLAIMVAIALIWRGHEPPPPSRRFRLFRKRDLKDTENRLKDRDNV